MFKLLKNFNKKDIMAIILCFILIIIQVWLELKMQDYMQKITILVQSTGSKMKDILTNGAFMLICALGSLIAAFITDTLLQTYQRGFL